MASLYKRGAKLWARLKDESGKWISRATPYGVEDRRKALRYAEAAQAAIDNRTATGTGSTHATVREYALGRWIEERREAGNDWSADRGRLAKHVIPVLGDMRLDAVRTVHIAELVRKLRFKSEPRLAPRSVRNVYAVVSAMFRDAAIAGRIDVTPCNLTDAQLGPIVDKDREWRSGAVFTREEAETLISDERIPVDRQLVYGFSLLAGLRPGETAALRWRHYDPSAQPLGRLLVALAYNTKANTTKGTKTETTKVIPVHPTLAAMLAEWKLGGWAAMMGRNPNPDDLIVPVPPATSEARTKARREDEPFRGYNFTGARWRKVDLPMLGWRKRSFYCTRSTFITLAIEDGADPAIIRDRITHTKPLRTAFDGYVRGENWNATCRELIKLRIVRRRELATPLATAPQFPNDLSLLLGASGGTRTPTRLSTGT